MSSLKRKSKKRLWALGGLLALLGAAPLVYAAVEAPTGLDNQTNGFVDQDQFDLDREEFEEREEIGEGLGPLYNAQACVECHQSPVTGATSQVLERRGGFFNDGVFSDHPGGSLLSDRGIAAGLHEGFFSTDNVQTFRTSLSVLGDGFVEAIPSTEFDRIRLAQPAGMKGTIVMVPVLEAAPGTTRIGRFGWKNQHASLLSFAAQAYRDEMGITSPLFPTESTRHGVDISSYDMIPDPEDPATSDHPFGDDVEAFARFMRSTKAPTSFPNATADSQAGAAIFVQIGCAHCHTPTITTAPAGREINGGTFIVPPQLGDKIIHPYSDFMLHDIGTGDGIVQGDPATRNKVRTAPLWNLRSRSLTMHDGALQLPDPTFPTGSIMRHGNQAEPVRQNYINLTAAQKSQLAAFLANL